ncbi:MAG: hypothetical protein Terrestrivirus4_103 [Terrestrivirus sp.]|uniref:Uncharacterized protein n=1 Tax=Terrestrivirus sp. TaxID=2487775 RepID=A0A3G4ZMH9_9VIRU|nr:MAG: hypothetical protein Terrestrivirus4_103 [Terrestrivirus sp.]
MSYRFFDIMIDIIMRDINVTLSLKQIYFCGAE